MPKCAITQSNYLPWRGYFDLIASVDTFVLYDDVQFTRRDWRNRNQIKTPHGLMWLTVPVVSKGRYTQSIRETHIDGQQWRAHHLRSLQSSYARAGHFPAVWDWFSQFYEHHRWETISCLNRDLITSICEFLGISTVIRDSSEFDLIGDRSERLASIGTQIGADCYVSGPAARSYLNEAVFKRCGIDVEWFDYSGYSEYPQLWGDFVANVSIVDLLFNCGTSSPDHIRHLRRT